MHFWILKVTRIVCEAFLSTSMNIAAVPMIFLFLTMNISHCRYGWSRARYVYSLISGVGIFFLGSGVSVYHGISDLFSPPVLASLPLVSYYHIVSSRHYPGAIECKLVFHKANLLSSREATFSFDGIAYHVSKSDADRGKSRFEQTNLTIGKPGRFGKRSYYRIATSNLASQAHYLHTRSLL